MIELVSSIPSEILHPGESSINTVILSSSTYSPVKPYILKTPFINSGPSVGKEIIGAAKTEIVAPTIVSPTLADIFCCYGDGYVRTHSVPTQHQQVMEAIRKCRSFELGYHIDVCPQCGHSEARPNSCGNRHCPACQGKNRWDWVNGRVKDLLPVPYYHLVFTLPDKIFPLCLYNQKLIYDLLFHSAAETLKSFGRDPQWLGAKMGFFGVLHTWGQTLVSHPHVHFVVPGGGIDAAGKWVWPKYRENNFLFPVHALAQVFRGKFIEGLKQAYQDGELHFPGQLSELQTEESFEPWLDDLVSKNWVVYSKAPFGSAEAVVRYVSRYTHRVAISNSRILSIDNGVIRFTFKNYKNKDECESYEELWEEMELEADEFIRRFLYHVLPQGYHRIRYYGFLSGSQKEVLHQIREELVVEEQCGIPEVTLNNWEGLVCPVCEVGVMKTALIVDRHGQVVYIEPELFKKARAISTDICPQVLDSS